MRSKSLLSAACCSSIGKKHFSDSFLISRQIMQMDVEESELEKEETFILWSLHNVREEQDLVE